MEETQSRATLIRKADIPKVKIETGKAINCRIGLMKVLTAPMTMAATVAAQMSVRVKPGTKYSTTRRAKTLIPSRTINSIIFI